jgi:hypothetical protein
MTPEEMIREWCKGCSCAPPERPEECPACTRALIEALERIFNNNDESERRQAMRVRRV